MCRRLVFALSSVMIVAALWEVRAGDWPTYRADAARTGYTAESLPAALSLAWTFESRHGPKPAWPTRTRQRFDVAYQPVIAGQSLYFGSSADGKVYALDVAHGGLRWEFFTGGPVRFAPAVWRDRVLAASDDGYLYCLAAADGRLIWKQRGGPRPDMLLGNDRMVSRWPARGGPVIADDLVYFAAGIWPSEESTCTPWTPPAAGWSGAMIRPERSNWTSRIRRPARRAGSRHRATWSSMAIGCMYPRAAVCRRFSSGPKASS